VSSLMLLEALSLAGFTLSLAGIRAAFGAHSPHLDKARWACLALTGSLLCASLIGVVAPWVLILSCLGFLISLQAAALACYAEPATVHEEPAWWPEFERDFRLYVLRRD
jgi:hypothetical protein